MILAHFLKPHPLTAAITLALLTATLPTHAGENFPKSPVPGAPTTAAADPASLWAFDVETAALWRISSNTTANYTVLPQIFSLRTPAHLRLTLGEGELTVRARFSLLAEPIAKGPESFYWGFSASPSVEYWLKKGGGPGTTCLYASVGGGLGQIDSGDAPGGQGRDLTLNWFATAGLRHYFTSSIALNAGVLFQHWSNGGTTDPNPGLDGLGPVLGLTWHF